VRALRGAQFRPGSEISMKHRLERVQEVIKRELGDLINREFEFRASLVTIQQVDVTPDLKNAHVYVSAIGTNADCAAAITTLNEHRRALQFGLSRRVVLKYTPHLHFHLDESIERGTRIIQILEEISEVPNPKNEK
jgi:ribosome-binding factor A